MRLEDAIKTAEAQAEVHDLKREGYALTSCVAVQNSFDEPNHWNVIYAKAGKVVNVEVHRDDVVGEVQDLVTVGKESKPLTAERNGPFVAEGRISAGATLAKAKAEAEKDGRPVEKVILTAKEQLWQVVLIFKGLEVLNIVYDAKTETETKRERASLLTMEPGRKGT